MNAGANFSHVMRLITPPYDSSRRSRVMSTLLNLDSLVFLSRFLFAKRLDDAVSALLRWVRIAARMALQNILSAFRNPPRVHPRVWTFIFVGCSIAFLSSSLPLIVSKTRVHVEKIAILRKSRDGKTILIVVCCQAIFLFVQNVYKRFERARKPVQPAIDEGFDDDDDDHHHQPAVVDAILIDDGDTTDDYNSALRDEDVVDDEDDDDNDEDFNVDDEDDDDDDDDEDFNPTPSARSNRSSPRDVKPRERKQSSPTKAPAH